MRRNRDLWTVRSKPGRATLRPRCRLDTEAAWHCRRCESRSVGHVRQRDRGRVEAPCEQTEGPIDRTSARRGGSRVRETRRVLCGSFHLLLPGDKANPLLSNRRPPRPSSRVFRVRHSQNAYPLRQRARHVPLFATFRTDDCQTRIPTNRRRYCSLFVFPPKSRRNSWRYRSLN